jgi:hypothetical protein
MSAISNLVLTTETEAVNTMLRSVGEAPIADVTTTTLLQAVNARAALRWVSREVQARGWEFNTEWDVELAVDGDGKIPIGSDVLRVDGSHEDANKRYVRRGSFLRNMTDHTFIFTGNVKAKVITFLSFEDLPEAARNYITIRAARQFAASDVAAEDGAMGFKSSDEARALVLLEEAEGDTGDHNVLTGTYDRFQIIDRAGAAGAGSVVLNDFFWNS